MSTSYYKVHTPQLPRGSWKWQRPMGIYVIYGPEEELEQVVTLNSVGSKKCPNTKAKYFGWGDSRYSGPRSKLGRAQQTAHEWAIRQGYEELP